MEELQEKIALAGGGESIFSELVFAKNGIENRDGGFESHHIAISTFMNHH